LTGVATPVSRPLRTMSPLRKPATSVGRPRFMSCWTMLIEPSLKKNIVFSQHNLATDGSFNEFQVIVCRGVLGGFNNRLRERVERLIYDSLSRFGILALGPSESLETASYEDHYALLDETSRLYQKNGLGQSLNFVRVERKRG